MRSDAAPPGRRAAPRRRNLVVLRAGDASLHPGWLDREVRDFDLFVSYYGSTPGRHADSADLYEMRSGPKWTGIDALSAPVVDAVGRTRATYLEFLEQRLAEFGAAFRAIAQADGGGVLVHCVGGKDRTGLLSALLLHLAGVSSEDIAADYALSEERLLPRHHRA